MVLEMLLVSLSNHSRSFLDLLVGNIRVQVRGVSVSL